MHEMLKGHQVRIGVVASTPLRSMGLASILEDALGVETIPLELDAASAEEDMDALLVDLNAPIETMLHVVGRLREEQPALKILVMGAAMPMEDIQALVGAGVKGFLLDSSGESEIRMAMEVVLDGSIWGPRKVLAKLIEANAALAVAPLTPVDEAITERELEVLNLLISGRSNREIAEVLGVEEGTVKSHMGKMLHKTASSNRVELALRALKERKLKNNDGY
jgi:DNA-binding NarL/FixJ family response regulator